MTALGSYLQRNNASIDFCDDLDDVTSRAAQLFEKQATAAVASHGRFTVAMSSCATVMHLNRRLGSEPFKSLVPWPKTHLFWTDGSCNPAEHRKTDIEMIGDVLLSRVQIPRRNVYPPPTAFSVCHRRAVEYEQTLRAFFGLDTRHLPRFDLISLGMADDGHIASLFPGSNASQETTRLVTATYINLLDEHRITLTAPVISNAATVMLLAVGENLAPILQEVLTGEYQPERIPLQLIRPSAGKLFYFIDQAAALRL